MSSELSNLTWAEAKKKLDGSKLAIVPVGSVEQHGLHLGLGSDWIEASEIARRVGEKSGKLVLPVMPYGVAAHHMDFPGVISLNPSTLRAVIFDILTSLHRHGVTRVLLINGHGGNMGAITDAVRAAKEEYGMLTAISQWWDILHDKPIHGQPVIAHAGYAETAFVLASKPEATRMHLAVLSETTQVDDKIELVSLVEARFKDGLIKLPLNTADVSNTGSMTEAHPDDVKGTKDYSMITPEFAEKLMEEVVDWLVEFAEAFEKFELPPVEVSEEKARKELE